MGDDTAFMLETNFDKTETAVLNADRKARQRKNIISAEDTVVLLDSQCSILSNDQVSEGKASPNEVMSKSHQKV